jgi:cobalt-zinc-cadmium efflux system outer membrane protein
MIHKIAAKLKGNEYKVFINAGNGRVLGHRIGSRSFLKKIFSVYIPGLALAALLSSGCVRYHPKPISAGRSLDDFEARGLDSTELRGFFQARQKSKTWPLDSWDLRSLTLAAFYYHPDLDVARARWGVAKAGVITAGERPNPSVGGLLGYNRTTPVAEITPWIPEIVLDIPIETAGKRGIRIREARHLSEAARLNILSVAWEVRIRLRTALLELYAARESESLLAKQQDIQSENVRLLEVQLAAGEVSAYAVTQARIALDNSRLAALEAARQSAEARVRLADAIGIPVKALDGAKIVFDAFDGVHADIPPAEVRRRALLNRSDVLAALSEYEASQAALQVEIRKQFPDIHLGPGFQLDQTDSKWTLGLTLELPIFNRNKGPIAEAEARRAETAARFLALQAQVIGEIDSADAACRSAVEKSKTADELLENLKKQENAAEARYGLGEISKPELLGVQLELASNALFRLDALVNAQQAIGQLEKAMQSPLDIADWVFQAPQRQSEQTKERKND